MSLIEVMISVFVVSIGALSATGLQIATKHNNRDAAQRLEATHLASTLIERMRSNNSPEALSAYTTLGAPTTGAPRPLGGDSLMERYNLDPAACVADPAECCQGSDSACAADKLVTMELWQLESVMDGVMEQVDAAGLSTGGLDFPTACITGPATAGGSGFYTVTIAFRGSLAMPEDTAVSCGHDARDTAGGVKIYGENNEYRRTLTVSAYIAPTVRK